MGVLKAGLPRGSRESMRPSKMYMPPGMMPFVLLACLSVMALISVVVMARDNTHWYRRSLALQNMKLELQVVEYLPESTLHEMRALLMGEVARPDGLVLLREAEMRQGFMKEVNGYCAMMEARLNAREVTLQGIIQREHAGEANLLNEAGKLQSNKEEATAEEKKLKQQVRTLDREKETYATEIEELQRDRARLADILKAEERVLKQANNAAPMWLGDLGKRMGFEGKARGSAKQVLPEKSRQPSSPAWRRL